MKNKLTLSELLQETPKYYLEALLLELANNDKNIKKILRTRLATDVSEVIRVKSEIRTIINNCSDKYGFIDCSSSYVFKQQMSSLMKNVFSRFISEKNNKDAFEIICMLFFEFGRLDIDDTYGAIAYLLNRVMYHFE